MKNNQGFTLIELIVVIAIMAIIAGISGRSLSSVSNQEAKDFINTYNALLSECKVETTSGMPSPGIRLQIKDGEYQAVLYKTVIEEEDDGSVTQREEIVRTEVLGEDHLICKFGAKEATYEELSKFERNTTLDVKFDRATGQINTTFTKISISNGRKIYYIELIPETGYHRIVQ